MSDVPIETIDLYGDSVCLHNLALLATDHIDPLVLLLRDLLNAARGHMSIDTLRHVLVAPGVDMPDGVQQYLRRVACGDHEPLGYVARTGWCSVEHERVLTTFLIVNEAMAQSITADNVFGLDNVAHFLETILHAIAHSHVRLRCRGDSQDSPRGPAFLEPFDVDQNAAMIDVHPPPIIRGSVRDLAASTLESYLTHRTKTAMMSTQPLVLMADEEDFRPVVPRRCGDLGVRLEHAADDLRSIITTACHHDVDRIHSWDRARRLLLRGVLDPLACHAAYTSHNPKDRGLRDIDQSCFYQNMLATFWPRASKEVQLAFDQELELEASLDTLTVLMSMLLTHLGIVVGVDTDGHQHVDFDRRWAGSG